MNDFLALQSDDPFNPAPMLILADHLEEQGDQAGATILRGLVDSGQLSIQCFAANFAASFFSRIEDPCENPNRHVVRDGSGIVDGFYRDRSEEKASYGLRCDDYAGQDFGNGNGAGDIFGMNGCGSCDALWGDD